MTELTLLNRNLLRDFFGERGNAGFYIHPLHGEGLTADFKVDIQELKDTYEIHAELPGLKKEDIRVTVDAGVLTISAETKQQDRQTKEGKVIRSERCYGAVSRSFQLPTEVDSSGSVAQYKDGVLKLTLHKRPSTQTHRIEIQ